MLVSMSRGWTQWCRERDLVVFGSTQSKGESRSASNLSSRLLGKAPLDAINITSLWGEILTYGTVSQPNRSTVDFN